MHDVVIVGAGPVGLFLAGELSLVGCSVLVLERGREPRSPLKAFPLGMRNLSAASAEALHRRGLLQPLLTELGAGEASDVDGSVRAAGHFAGITPDAAGVDLAALPPRLPSPALDGRLTSLEAVEVVLAERAVRLGVEIRRGVQVTAVEQDEEGVVARSGEDEYAARWLVGCDGGRSTVRSLAGFDFVGTEPWFTGYVVHATIGGAEKLRKGFVLTSGGLYLNEPVPGYLAFEDFDDGTFDRSRTPSREHLQTVLRRASGTDVTIDEVHLASSFTDRAMQTSTYRRGRVLLAGDAAHVHSPLGGQGLNLGIGDALNLGWKLGAVVRGRLPEALLDTYTRERHPVAQRVLDWTRAQVAVMRPGPYASALQEVVRDLLMTGDGATYVYQRLSGMSVRYDLGGDHPLVGRSAPEFRLEDGTRLADLLQDGRGVALDFTGAQRLRSTAGDWADRVRYASGKAVDDLGHGAVLLRPDGVVVWADGHEPDLAAFAKAATEWFGQPG
ncbi:2-polyprenyl-6-methoxyphenol hydroxylase [Lentzea fradiae]|uniref:2-polyprenyl-6-methoxyphenol hydroxylase n=1 Tax=Lentzea fradiae TaxID=200378 RepID=A0A1G7KX76_9PSEU|nr:FAD-dependent monooxygenase [Lentzea fradiae]SDF41696.1 2-polyprenyl-6-methoxyphenol hydroxylase [Lentzea fradiae]